MSMIGLAGMPGIDVEPTCSSTRAPARKRSSVRTSTKRSTESTMRLRIAEPSSGPHEIAVVDIAETFGVEDERHARREVRLADDEASAMDGDAEGVTTH